MEGAVLVVSAPERMTDCQIASLFFLSSFSFVFVDL